MTARVDWSAFDSDLIPLEGGYSGETFVGNVVGEEVVVRIFAGRPWMRGADGEFSAGPAEVQAAVLSLLHGLFPVPRVWDLRRPEQGSGLPAVLITERLPGINAQVYYDRADARQRRALGERLGQLVSDLAGIPMLTAGTFADADLRVEPFTGAALDLESWAEQQLGDLAPMVAERLHGLCMAAQERLDRAGRACLVHGDLNLKNLLVDPHSGELTGVVDWEFAHAGHPATDLGNLLRHADAPEHDGFAEAVLDRYRARFGGTRAEARDLASAADLFALIELAGRAGVEPHNTAAHQANERLLRRLDRSAQGGIS